MIKNKAILPSMPALGALIALIAGLLVAMWLNHWVVWIAIVVALLSIASYVLGCRRCSVIGVFVLIGIATWIVDAAPDLHLPANGKNVAIVAHVCDAKQNDRNQRLILNIERSNEIKDCKILVYFHSLTPIITQGDNIEAQLLLQNPDGAFRVPDEFSMAPYCRANNISAIAHCNKDAIRILGYKPSLSDRLTGWRRDISDFIYYRSGLRPDAAEMLNALLTGNDEFLNPDLRAEYASAGLAHVLALSGTHLAVIVLILSVLLLPVRVVGQRNIGLVIMLIVLWSYVVFTGCPPSVVRACIMVSVVGIGRIIGHGSNSMNSLFVAAILIIVVWPKSLLQAGFQLSFAAVAAILMFGTKIRQLGGRNSVLRLILGWIGVCTAAVAGTMLLSAWHFHEIPLLFLASNLPVGLLMPWFMSLGVVRIVLSVCNIDAYWLTWTLNLLYDAMTVVASTIGGDSRASVKGLYFSAWWLVPYFMTLVLLWLAWERRRLIYVLWGIFVAIVAIFVADMLPTKSSGVESYAISDYYATTLLLRSGRNGWLVTDASEKHHNSLAERTAFRFNEYMACRGIDSLQIVTNLKTENFAIEPSRWTTDNVEICILNRDYREGFPPMFDNCLEKPLILLVTVGFRGDIVDITKQSGAKLTALSRRLSSERRQKLYLQLQEARLPCAIGLEGNLIDISEVAPTLGKSAENRTPFD